MVEGGKEGDREEGARERRGFAKEGGRDYKKNIKEKHEEKSSSISNTKAC